MSGSLIGVLVLLLFCVGGLNLVCGYGYQSIGNSVDGFVLLIKYLMMGMVEYQYWFNCDWGVVMFFDIGIVIDVWGECVFYLGVGVGVCWCSLVGLINVDVVYGLCNYSVCLYLMFGIVF